MRLLSEIIHEIDTIPSDRDLYAKKDKQMRSETPCVVVDTRTDTFQEEIRGLNARGFVRTISIIELQDVLGDARLKKRHASVLDLIDALNYYLDYHRFL